MTYLVDFLKGLLLLLLLLLLGLLAALLFLLSLTNLVLQTLLRKLPKPSRATPPPQPNSKNLNWSSTKQNKTT